MLTGGSYFEGPRWHEGAWWASDFYTHQVTRVTPDGGATVVTEVEQQPSGLGWLPDGSLLIVSMKDQRLLRLADGELRTHADLAPYCAAAQRLVVDAAGRAYVGDFGFDLMGGGAFATSSLKRVDPDGTVSVVAADLHFPNGSVITPDGATLIVGETWGNRFTAFDLAAGGTLINRRVWAQFGPLPAGHRRSPTWSRRSCSAPTAARWTPRGTSGSPTASTAGSRGWRPAAGSSTRSPPPRAWACSPARSAATTAARC